MSSQSRNDYLKHFSLSNWKALPASQKSQHTMSNCSACQVHHFDFQSLFPTTTAGKCKPQTLIWQAVMESENKGNKTIKPTQKAIKAAVKHIYSNIDAPFQNVFKVSWAGTTNKKKQNWKEMRTQTEGTPGEAKSSGAMVETWCRHDACDKAVLQSEGQRTKLVFRIFQGSHCSGQKTEEDGRSWAKKA